MGINLGEVLPVDPVSRPRKATHPRLGIEPLRGSRRLLFVRGVLSIGPICEDATAPANGHSAVGFGKMILVQPTAQVLRFGCCRFG